MQSSKKRTLLNICIAAGITAVIMLMIAALFDYYFDLNDDVLMKDLLSGSYTGTPAAHNIQMLYPVSALISLLYRLFRKTNVYGIFLCLCQYACLFLILHRTINIEKNRIAKFIAVTAQVLMYLGCLTGHLIYVQYTFTVAMMAGTAAFLVITGSGRSNRILVCIIIWLSFLVRSEMLLLMLPIAGMAWGYRFISDYKEEKKKEIRTIYFRWALILFAGLLICKGIDVLAYSSDRWTEFRNLFDSRTELYDYQTIPDYESNRDFYESIGLDETEVELLFNYNFGLDEEIDSKTMLQVAEYAKSIKEETPMPQRIKAAFSKYIYRLHHFGFQEGFEYPQTDAPWNLIILIMYLSICIAAVLRKREGIFEIAFLAVLFIVRSLLWMYILVGERDPIRITHGLMFAEMALLLGIMINNISSNSWKVYVRAGLIIVSVISAIYVPNNMTVSQLEAEDRKMVNEPYIELYKYIDDKSENFYWIDVYSSVSYSEKMFTDTDNSLDNFDILGGWACKSPLQDAKLKAFGFKDIQSSLLSENVYLVVKSEYSTDWLMSYYNNKGVGIELSEVDTVADTFRIIKVNEKR
ncbi:hypothetical protein SAMN02745229_01355 [Butyrivibrio fibrisolvens DSM 3071]|uniref:Dolichyl-phosphate-mannose-protein mannosyltransferase n=1 Tax=Butyrivibrio fibrisolvens DSM 3071 TaxID=1121131 RepID=A0A1M5XVL9_BUTFI|nr:hypothetical protein [Butyrivibrio fibrisolvens]SHI03877.1 hypothetical protein SAMN02745229_01355 [Butyrivibrio fibrisolvens DSM 3071]